MGRGDTSSRRHPRRRWRRLEQRWTFPTLVVVIAVLAGLVVVIVVLAGLVVARLG